MRVNILYSHIFCATEHTMYVQANSYTHSRKNNKLRIYTDMDAHKLAFSLSFNNERPVMWGAGMCSM